MPTVYIDEGFCICLQYILMNEGFCICLQYILMKGFVYAYSIY